MKYFVTFFLSFFLFFQGFNLLGNNVDSLKTLLRQTHELSDKIELLTQLGTAYYEKSPDTSIFYFQQALELAEQIDDELKSGLIYGKLGDLSMLKDYFDQAENYYQKAAEYLSKNDEKSKEIIRVYLALGNRFIEKNNFPQAMDNYLKGIRISDEIGDSTYLPFLYNSLGIVYLNMEKTDQALSLYTKALGIFEKLSDSTQIAGINTNIGSIYIELNNLELARNYYLKGRNIFHRIGNNFGEAHAFFKLGLLDMMQEDYHGALFNLESSLELLTNISASKFGSKTMFLAETYINLGITYLSLSEYSLAYECLNKGYEMARKTNQLGLIALSAQNLSKYHRLKKQYDLALNFFEIFKQFSDSIYNEENVRKLAQLELQYQFDTTIKKNELKRKLEEQRNQRKNLVYLLISGSLLFLLIIVILFLRLETNKKRKIVLERKVLSEKLEFTNKELTTYVMYLSRKNEFILKITQKLRKILDNLKPENKVVVSELITELQSNSDMVSWNEFEVRFQQVYTDFYKKLTEKFPDLSPNELRLCAFFRLNMTTKEIAAITYQSLNSIKVARYRLRKKLGISNEENLVSFLSKF